MTRTLLRFAPSWENLRARPRCQCCGCLFLNHAKTPPLYCCVCSCPAFQERFVERKSA